MDGRGAGTLNLRAHRRQASGEVHDFGFACGVLEHGLAVGEHRRHHQVLGARDRHRVEHDARAFQFGRLGFDHAALDLDLGTHGFETHQMQVHRPRADGATAGQRHMRLPACRHERPQHQDRGAHGFHQLVGRGAAADFFCVHRQRVLLVHGHVHTHLPQQAIGGGDVFQMRHVLHGQRLVRQQRGAEDRQRGVLGTGRTHLALEHGAAFDQQLVHQQTLLGARVRNFNAWISLPMRPPRDS